MPPYLPRKRKSTSPPARASKRHRPKASLFDAVDTPHAVVSTPAETKALLDKLGNDSDSSLGDADSDEFEDVPISNRDDNAKGSPADHLSDDGDGEPMDWEDVNVSRKAEEDVEDVSISIQDNGSIVPEIEDKSTTIRKGPSKRDRMIRNGTHQIHVQCLMFHNAVRNAWLCNKELQHILVDGLSDGMKKEYDQWRRDMALPPKFELKTKQSKKKRAADAKAKKNRDGRDWGHDADRLEKGAVNMSRSDPLLRFLKIICAYWRKRFTVTAPGLRKMGYMPLKRLRDELNGWKVDMHDERYGERVESLNDMKKLAKQCEGSRDLGAQLFTALLRGLGFETRMVANLQPAGIGFGKLEDAIPRSKRTDTMVADIGGISSTSTPGKKAASGRVKAPKKTVINLESDDSELSSAPSEDVVEVNKPRKPTKRYDRDLAYPHYWTEVLSAVSKSWVPIDPMVLSTVATNGELLATFEPRGKAADQARQVMCYTLAHASDGSAKDVTVRYLKKHQLPGRTKGNRMPAERIKIFNQRGKVLRTEDYDWFKTVMSGYDRREHLRTTADDIEEATDLKPLKAQTTSKDVSENSEAFYKSSAEYVLIKHLRREEALPESAEPVRTFTYTKAGQTLEEPVYRRDDVLACKTAESWHKEGREVQLGAQPMKMVPMRAVTAVRKAEIQAIERETGEKAKQGLFSRAQTDWIIPPPIGPDRQIPRNAFNNIDIYTPSMVPEGAVHIPLRGTMRICVDLGISFAEACTGFEFGNKRAVPVIQGVVVAEENALAVRDAWKIKDAERRRKEAAKKQAMLLGIWRMMVVGLRIVARLRNEYDDVDLSRVEVNPFVKRAQSRPQTSAATGSMHDMIEIKDDNDEAAAGGFLRPGADGDDDDDDKTNADLSLDLEQDTHREKESQVDTSVAGDEDEAERVTIIGRRDAAPMSLHSRPEDSDEVHNEVKSGLEPNVKAKQSKAALPKKSSKPKVTKAVSNPTRAAAKKPGKKAMPDLEDDDMSGGIESDKSESKSESETRPEVIRSSRAKRLSSSKATKSHYFKHGDSDSVLTGSDDDNINEDQDQDQDQDASDEPEVVKPRRTTARTRASRG